MILPRALHVKGLVQTENRSRGIFTIPVYRADLELVGEFVRPPASDLGVDAQTISWERAQVAIGITDPRAIQSSTALSWNGARRMFLPGAGGFSSAPAGVHAAVDLSGTSDRFAFTVPLSVNGSMGVYLAPVGENTVVELASNSANPSFQGGWLPVRRQVSDSGFQARWEIPFLGRNYPQVWSVAESRCSPARSVCSWFSPESCTSPGE